MFKIIRVLLISAFSVLFVASCSAPAAGTTPVLPSPTFTNTPLFPSPTYINTLPYPTITPTQRWATAVIRQPTETTYCYFTFPPDLLPISDAQGLNEDEIVRKLMELYFAYYHDPQAPDFCRIEDYHIDKVYYDERYPYLPLEPKGDFMRAVAFSVKPVQLVGFWVSGGAVRDPQNWAHLGENVAVFRFDSGYTMKFARP